MNIARTGIASLLSLCAASAAQFVEPGIVTIFSLHGENPGDGLGWAVAELRDIDGDGAMEAICPAPAFSGNTGRVYVRSGRTGAQIPGMVFTGAPGSRLGAGVSDAGDVNHDGVWDVICGAPAPATSTGIVSIYSGAGGTLIRQVSGQAPGDGFGYAVGGIGDANGDGFGEVVVGAPGHDTGGSGAGRAYVISGLDGSILRFHDGPNAAARFGCGVASAGDLTGDGVADYIIGANGAGTAPVGRAYVYNGATGAPLPFSPLAPSVSGGTFGDFFVAGMADVDGDLRRDLYVGDYNAGRSYAFSGQDGHIIHTFTGTSGIGPGRGAGDLNHDGHEDVIVGAWTDAAGGGQAGSILFFSGRTGALLRKITGNVPGANLGYDAVGIGDVNGDGEPDSLLAAGGGAGNVVHVVAGAKVCYPDCNSDGTLNLSDFGCFQTMFATSAPYADCNGDGVRNLADFGCFQTRFALACP